MNLTPVRVRGKRVPRSGKNGAAASPGQPSTARNPTTAAKRPRDLDMSNETNAVPLSDAASSKRRKSQRLSGLQRLPVEILEEVFFHSRNLNLPLCDPMIGRLLSSKATLIGLIIQAFGPTWSHYFGLVFDFDENLAMFRSRDEGIQGPKRFSLTSKTLGFIGDSKFQTAVLNCPWVTASLLLDAQQAWYRKCKRNITFTHLFIDLDDDEVPAPLPMSSAAAEVSRGQGDPLLKIHPFCARHNMRRRRPSAAESDSESNRPLEVDFGGLRLSPPRLDQLVLSYLDQPPSLHACMEFDQTTMARLLFSEVDDWFPARVDHAKDHNSRRYNPDQSFRRPETRKGPNAEEHDSIPREFVTLGNGTRIFLPEYFSNSEPFNTILGRQMLSDVLEDTRIPESLLLVGPSSDAARQRLLREHDRDRLRKRLQHVSDLLFWLVRGGAMLDPKDNWEVTMQGFQFLLSLDFGKEEARDAEGESIDMLACKIVSLFHTLGVFFKQWPREETRRMWPDNIWRRAAYDVSFAESRTYARLYYMWLKNH